MTDARRMAGAVLDRAIGRQERRYEYDSNAHYHARNAADAKINQLINYAWDYGWFPDWKELAEIIVVKQYLDAEHEARQRGED